MGSMTEAPGPKLPTLDTSKWLEGTETERQEFAKELTECLQRHGFVKIVNHGMSDADVRDLYRWNREFFELPVNRKEEIVHKTAALEPQRGWSRIGVEKSAKLNWGREPHHGSAEAFEDMKDAREHLDLGAPEDEEYPNKWPRPEDLVDFRPSMEKHYRTFHNLSLELLGALELALKLPAAALSAQCAQHASELRLGHYPPISVADMESGHTSRIWPHTDLGVLTLLFQDEVGGLEIEDRENKGTFFPVQREEWNELVVNVSETLERWTNGVLPAGVHQVTVPPKLKGADKAVLPSRYSIPFFLKADRTADIGVLPHFLANGEKKRYESMTALEFHLHRLTTAY